MIIDELFEGPQLCPECGGISFSDLILAEKKDACYYKVKASAKVWPSAYASGRLVQCRKKGAANYGKSKNEGVAEGQLNEFAPEGFNDDEDDELRAKLRAKLDLYNKKAFEAGHRHDNRAWKKYTDAAEQIAIILGLEYKVTGYGLKIIDEGVAEATGDEKFDTMMGRIQQEPKYPDPQMPPTDVKDLYQWAVKNNKPYHKIFAEWANREGFKSVAPALHKAGTLDSDALDYWTPRVWKIYWGEVRGIDSEMPPEWAKQRIPDELRDYLESVFDAYDHIVFDWPTEYRQIGQQGMAEQQELDEKWSQKYKKSINCANPKGFSQRAHCAGRKKNEDVAEAGPSKRDPLDYPPLEGPGGSGAGGYTGGPSPFRGMFGRSKEAPVTEPQWSTTKIPGVDIHTGPPPTSKSASTNVKIDPAADVPAYIRKGLPDPVTTPVNKPKISVRPGETMDQAIQRTKAEQEFGRFLQGQSGQTFGKSTAGAGRGGQGGPTAAQATSRPSPEFEKTKQKWDQQNNPAPGKGQRPWGSDIDDQPGWARPPGKETKPSVLSKLLGGELEETSHKKREQPEVNYDDEYDAMVARVKKLAGLGPMKTVYDPTKRVYRNMPTAVQPKK